MKPERTNYEIWLIDYLDGTLDNNQVDQLMYFLDENPDIKDELADMLTYNIKPVSGLFKYKNRLKKSASELSDKQFEYLCISAAEHDLSEPQIAELEAIIAGNPGKRKTLDLYKRAILVAPVVKFRNKSDLRKLTVPQKIFRLSVIGLSAAAGIAMFVTIFNMPGKKVENKVPLVSANVKSDSIIITKTSPLFLRSESRQSIIAPSKREFIVEMPDSAQISTSPPSLNPASSPNLPTGQIFNARPPSMGEFEPLNISKLDFKEDVRIGRDIPWNVTAMIAIEIRYPGIIAKPGFNQYVAKIFRERILKNKTPESGSLKAYEIADAGIIGLNKLFGWQMSLKQNRDEKGELKSLYFSSRILKFNTPVKKM